MKQITFLTIASLTISANAFALNRTFDCGDSLTFELHDDGRIQVAEGDWKFWLKPATRGSNASGKKFEASTPGDDIELFMRKKCIQEKSKSCKMTYRNTTSDVNELDCEVVK